VYIIGISAFYHDSAACILHDGIIVAAAQEERFTRKKNDKEFPRNALLYCLSEAKIPPEEVNYVVFYEKPFIKFERLLETYLAFAPRGVKSFVTSMPLWVKDKLYQKANLIIELESLLGNNVNWTDRLLFSEHHLSHAASAYYPSPYDSAAVLTMDGVGEWATTTLAIGEGRSLSVIKEIRFPHSLGLLYSAFTYYTGFKVNSGEYKMMGLAPYGVPIYTDKIKDNLIEIEKDGSFRLNMLFFNYCTSLTMTNNRFNKLFGGLPRKSEDKLTQRHMNLAASVQKVIEEIIIKLAISAAKEIGKRNLCLAGGVALNCVANGVLLREKIFDSIWIQPASGDAGGALGAALAVYHIMLSYPLHKKNGKDAMEGSYLGPSFSEEEICALLDEKRAIYTKHTEEEMINLTATFLANGKTIGWMSGRLEFGPRALGARSILADPRSLFMQKQLNLKVKRRESFRPFAPSILCEDILEWFDIDVDSPYMLFVANVTKKRRKKLSSVECELTGLSKLRVYRSEIPAVTHVDYSARVQTVHKETNPIYYKLIARFKQLTGCPVVVNTSFNVRGEPIVCSPEDALMCFNSTELDVLVIGNMILLKADQGALKAI